VARLKPNKKSGKSRIKSFDPKLFSQSVYIKMIYNRFDMGKIIFKSQIEKPQVNVNFDRRSNQDRRKSFNKSYFLNGGREKRSGKERRFIWYMTQ